MGKSIRYFPWAIILLALFACNLSNRTASNNVTQNAAFSGDISPVRLTVQALNANTTFNTVGQVINYSYVVTNAGSSSLAGPVIVTDDKTTVVCPNINTIGNLNNNLDPNETIICASAYAITQADLNTGSVTSKATARVGGIDSSQVTTTVRMGENRVLAITVNASPTSYSQAGQTITYTYVVKNTGSQTLGPTQFVVTDNRFSAPINCGPQGALLLTNEAVSCTAVYTITQNDMGATQVTNSATASGGGAGTIQPASVTILNTNPQGGGSGSSLVRGTTIKHTVVTGEWLIQIARCYGADIQAVINANPQIADPHWILPAMVVTVPNIGSNGNIYGPKDCVVLYTVQSSDTWDSIARNYNADYEVLRAANRNVTLANGVRIKVPRNSAGGYQTPVPVEAIRINIPAGSTSVTLSGSVGLNAKLRYVLNASQGQTLGIKVTAPANEVGFTVTSPANVVLKALDANPTWSGIVPTSGDHSIEVTGLAGASTKLYTLEVSLTTPTGFERVADINNGGGDSSPAYLSVFNGILYFRAQGSDGAGAELWKYDGAAKTTSRVADINPGAGSSEPAFLTAYTDGMLYFRANGNDAAGTELWRFNGSATGRLTDINPGIGDSNPAHLAVFNNTLYFSANGNDGAGIELWKTDGKTYSRAADIHAGTGDSSPAYLTVFNNALYFSATSNDGKGTELYKYDGINPPSRVTDINPEVGNSNPAYLAVFNNVLYFSATDGASGAELWKYDGVNAPSRVADINAGAGDSAPTFLTVFNNALYFGANSNDGTGFELWKYDGSGAKRVSDLNKAGDTSPAYLAVYNNELYFQANGGDGAGKELWKFKGP